MLKFESHTYKHSDLLIPVRSITGSEGRRSPYPPHTNPSASFPPLSSQDSPAVPDNLLCECIDWTGSEVAQYDLGAEKEEDELQSFTREEEDVPKLRSL
jgi:hypothetical protein